MNQVIFIEKKDFKIQQKIANNKEYNLFLVDTLYDDTDLKIDLNLENNCKTQVIISILNKQNFNKNYFINVNHNGNNSQSKCEVYCVGNGTSHSKINLLAKIDGKSFGNNCSQMIKGILISQDSKIEGEPNLIIDTNNVKAKHALAIGKLNLNHLFYLQAKGISKKEAIELLLLSYFNVVLSKIENETKRNKLTDYVLNQIGSIDI